MQLVNVSTPHPLRQVAPSFIRYELQDPTMGVTLHRRITQLEQHWVLKIHTTQMLQG
jgi:hypothetical protein